MEIGSYRVRHGDASQPKTNSFMSTTLVHQAPAQLRRRPPNHNATATDWQSAEIEFNDHDGSFVVTVSLDGQRHTDLTLPADEARALANAVLHQYPRPARRRMPR